MRSSLIGFAILLALVLCATYTAAALVDVSRVLPDDLVVAFRQMAHSDPHRASGMDLMIVDGALPESSPVLRFIIISLYLGAVPAALTAILLAARTERLGHRWSAGWENFFVAGFVFQFGSLLFTSLMLYVYVVDIGYGYDPTREAVNGALLPAASVAISAVALWAWRRLRASLVEDRLGIS